MDVAVVMGAWTRGRSAGQSTITPREIVCAAFEDSQRKRALPIPPPAPQVTGGDTEAKTYKWLEGRAADYSWGAINVSAIRASTTALIASSSVAPSARACW